MLDRQYPAAGDKEFSIFLALAFGIGLPILMAFIVLVIWALYFV